MSHRPSSAVPPRALMVTLMLCLTALLLGYVTYPGLYQSPVQAVEVTPVIQSAAPTSTPTPRPTPTAAPTVPATETSEPDISPEESPLPSDTGSAVPGVTSPVISVDHDYSQAVPKGVEADPETWFQDAVFIGDSRTHGFHLYSGVKGGSYLVHTGLTVFQVVDREAVLGSGEEKYSVLSALKNRQYGKVYVALGVNELGWFNAQRYAEAFGKLVDAIRDIQPNAVIYIQSIIPVCPSVCKEHGQAYYVTNENIADYNNALAEMCEEKEVLFLNVSEALVDPDTWELPADLTADGVHFKKAGYQAWLSYLLCHTGEEEPVEETPIPEETPTPTPSPEPIPTPADGMPPAAPEATPADREEH